MSTVGSPGTAITSASRPGSSRPRSSAADVVDVHHGHQALGRARRDVGRGHGVEGGGHRAGGQAPALEGRDQGDPDLDGVGGLAGSVEVAVAGQRPAPGLADRELDGAAGVSGSVPAWASMNRCAPAGSSGDSLEPRVARIGVRRGQGGGVRRDQLVDHHAAAGEGEHGHVPRVASTGGATSPAQITRESWPSQ